MLRPETVLSAPLPADETKIPGSKVTLRDWRSSDLDPYALWLAPGHRWQDLDGPYYAKPSIDKVLGIVEKKRTELEAGELPSPRTNLAVADRDVDEMIGMVTWAWESRETDWLTVGIVVFDPAHWGRGLGYEALGLRSDYLFREMPEIVRLDLRTWSGNVGMMRLAEKFGYLQEARFRKARIVAGRYYDGLGYGVLREEWEQLYPAGFAERLRRSEAPPRNCGGA